MMRKLLVLVACGLIQQVACSRMRFEQGFHEPLYRHEPHIQGGPVFRREHFFPRDSIPPPEQILPQPTLMRGEPIYGNEPLVGHPPSQQIPTEDFLSNEQLMQTEPIIRNEAFIRPEPIIRREPYLRREPILRREPLIRSEALFRGGRPGGIFRNEPNAYTFMVSQCPCHEHAGPQDAFFQVPQQQQTPIVAHRIIFPKPVIKPPPCQPIVAFPRIQRYMRKSFKPITENVHYSAPPTPVQEYNTFSQDPVTFSTNFQNQAQQQQQQQQQQENTSEPNQNNSVTVRTVPQMPNPLTLAQVSSIC